MIVLEYEVDGDEWVSVLKLCGEKLLRSLFESSELIVLEPAMKVEVRREMKEGENVKHCCCTRFVLRAMHLEALLPI